jgi:proline iminopeptidase
MEKALPGCLFALIIVASLSIVVTKSQGQDYKASDYEIDGFIQSVDDVILYFRIVGSGSDTLVILHGGPGLSFDYLAPDLEPLEELYTVIYYDQRSAGMSTILTDASLLHIDRYIADLDEVRRYFGIERLTLFGHSWGAVLGARYTRMYPEHVLRLVMVSPGSVRYDPYEEQFLHYATAWMDSSTLAEFWKLQAAFENASDNVRAACREFFDLYNRGGFYDPSDPYAFRRIRGDFCSAPEPVLQSFFKINQLTFQSLGEFDWRGDFRDVGIPVLIITGVHDIFPENFREWEAAFPNGQLVLLDRAGHFPYVEQPKEFFQRVWEFLDNH